MKVCACSAVVEEVVVSCAGWLVDVVLNDVTRGCCTVVVVVPVCVVDAIVVVDAVCVVDIVCVIDTVDGDKTIYLSQVLVVGLFNLAFGQGPFGEHIHDFYYKFIKLRSVFLVFSIVLC